MGSFDCRKPVCARRLMLWLIYLFRFESGCKVAIHKSVALFAVHRSVVLANGALLGVCESMATRAECWFVFPGDNVRSNFRWLSVMRCMARQTEYSGRLKSG